MQKRVWLGCFLGVLLLLNGAQSPAAEWAVQSPDDGVRAVIVLETGRLSYRVDLRSGQEWRSVLGQSPLGMRLVGLNLSERLTFVRAEPPRSVQDRYTLLHGKRREVAVDANVLRLVFAGNEGVGLELEFRCQADGVAFRQRVTGPPGDLRTLQADDSGFTLPSGAKVWCAPSDKATLYTPAYETYYENGIPAGKASPLESGWSFPLLFRTGDGAWGLITEAGVFTNFCGSRLAHQPEQGTYRIALPLPEEGNAHGSAAPSAALPWETPWRVVMVGHTLQPLVASTFVTDVCPPAGGSNWSWVRPGRVAWSWWSDNPSPKFAARQKKFVDFAAEMSWEYVLVDANWTIMEEGNVLDVIRYAKDKDVGVLLWYNSGGPHNLVTEKPRDSLTYSPVRLFELDLLATWGVKGIKVDFFQSDKQEVIQLYHGLMRDAAAKQIMVNFHGCTLPRGWERTHPNLMSMEAVRGAECYIFDPKYPTNAPVQNTILPFTRNVVGPMDYTPVALSDNRYPHLTTTAHELALAVVFESGWLHFADKPEAYRALPSPAVDYLKHVPVAWEETKLLDGFPGEFVVMARRAGNRWHVAAINGRETPREVAVNLDALGGPRHDWTLLEDSPAGRLVSARQLSPKPGEVLRLNLKAHGGCVAY